MTTLSRNHLTRRLTIGPDREPMIIDEASSLDDVDFENYFISDRPGYQWKVTAFFNGSQVIQRHLDVTQPGIYIELGSLGYATITGANLTPGYFQLKEGAQSILVGRYKVTAYGKVNATYGGSVSVTIHYNGLSPR
ncbi:MAG TPA: hypothetical protein VKC60_01530 [Opitutaceae bacterium]|nr:hypothetical protein [Opitutaceae bacterium]